MRHFQFFAYRKNALLIALFALAFSCTAQQKASENQHALDMTVVKPESVGFSSERLERLHQYMKQTVDDKKISGVVTILARHGKVVDYWAYGQRDLASGALMTRDTIFRDYSMTKPVTGLAMMTLYEQGKWQPSDPVSKFIPEFAHLKVFNGFDIAGKMILVDPDHAPTMVDLMTHTAGFTYGFLADTAVDQMYKDAKVLGAKTPQDFIDLMAKLPLAHQPGTTWNYSVSMDIEGVIVERLSGQSLPDFMHDNIFKPLGMRDAGFYVPAEKRSRFAVAYKADKQGNLLPDDAGLNTPDSEQPTAASGGGGLVSTAEDYYRFAQMLANHGELDGHRYLSPSTVKLMSSNHLPRGVKTAPVGRGLGYGYNVEVDTDPSAVNQPEGKGTFGWNGAAGTWFWIDPENDIVFVGMIQIAYPWPPVDPESRILVYQALVDPSK